MAIANIEPHKAAADRYERMVYRRAGHSGLKLPVISLGAWETFGGYADAKAAQDCFTRAFDCGVTHFDLANGYGQPPGNAEIVVGRVLRQLPRDEILIATKAGFPMWPGPYGDGGSRKYLIASCDQSLQRLGVDYVDIFYHHRPDPETPVAETIAALGTLVQQGKALYVGLSNYSGQQFLAAMAAARELGVTITLHQPQYNMLSRRVETDLFPHTREAGVGVAAFAPMASGLLTSKHLNGEVPAGSRGLLWPGQWVRAHDQQERARILGALNDIAKARGQTLAQMALAWDLRDEAVTTVIAGVSKLSQLEDNLGAVKNLAFSAEELAAIDALVPQAPAKR